MTKSRYPYKPTKPIYLYAVHEGQIFRAEVMKVTKHYYWIKPAFKNPIDSNANAAFNWKSRFHRKNDPIVSTNKIEAIRRKIPEYKKSLNIHFIWIKNLKEWIKTLEAFDRHYSNGS